MANKLVKFEVNHIDNHKSDHFPVLCEFQINEKTLTSHHIADYFKIY